MTCTLLSKDEAPVMRVSPKRRHPKKVTRATAHTAACCGVSMLRPARRQSRCSMETGALAGRVDLGPSLFAEMRAMWTQSSSPYQGAR